MPHIPMEYTVDLGKTINVTPLHTLFAMGDDNAHRFAFSIVQDGKPVDLSGCTVLATYTNFSPHGVTVNLEGKIEDGKAVALLAKACYTMEGRFAIVVRLKNSVGTSAIFYGDGYMSRTTSDTVIDGDYIIYDVNTLLEKLKEINEATSRANAAAQSANTSAETANAAASNANTEAQNANTAANTANASAQTAESAAGKIDAMTVSATPLDAGTATAALTLVDGHYHLALGLPKGDTGATPRISVQVATGAAGSEASVSVSGTAEEPVITLTIPKGDTGNIGALSINGKTPDASGSVTLGIGDIDGLQTAIESAGSVKTVAGKAPDEAGNVAISAADVGARESDWMPTAAQVGAASTEEVSALKNDKLDKTATAVDSNKLGGQLPSYYATAESVSNIFYNNAGAHNSIYRGKDLGSAVTAEQYAAIQAGTFDDMYIGDYWTIGGVTYRIAAFDYYLRSGDTDMTTHHVTLVPDDLMYNHAMNDSNVTTGGYVGSKMYTTGLADAKTTINNAFGSAHILTHRQFLCNAVSNGKPSGISWYDSTVELMTEQNVYGGKVFGAGNNGSTIPALQTVVKSQYPLFAFRPDLISNRTTFWLRDVVSAAFFVLVGYDGLATYSPASSANGVRPAFSIKS